MKAYLPHHAFLIKGEGKSVLPLLHKRLKGEHGIDIEGHADVWGETIDTFGIDEARRLSEHQSRRTLPNTEQLLFISFNTMTREAQGALLKVLEEPTERTHIFLITPHADTLLPTLRSRLSDAFSFDTETKSSLDAETFLHASYEKRLSMIEPLIKEKDAEGTHLLLSNILSLIHKERKNLPEHKTALQGIQKMLNYTTDPATSVKMILEHVTLTTPIL